MGFCSRFNVSKLFHLVHCAGASRQRGELLGLTVHELELTRSGVPLVRLFLFPLMLLLQDILLLYLLVFSALIRKFIFHNVPHWSCWAEAFTVAYAKIYILAKSVRWGSANMAVGANNVADVPYITTKFHISQDLLGIKKLLNLLTDFSTAPLSLILLILLKSSTS